MDHLSDPYIPQRQGVCDAGSLYISPVVTLLSDGDSSVHIALQVS